MEPFQKSIRLETICWGLFVLLVLTGCRAASTAPPPTIPALATSKSTPIQPTKTPKPPDPTGTPTGPREALLFRSADGMAMVLVPGGSFPMGSTASQVEKALALCRQHYHPCNRWYYERESPQHTVSLDDFYLDQTEVTNAQYHLCVQAGVCIEPTTCKKGEPTFSDPGKSGHPVVCVGWEDAREYCRWAGGRLPTEAEWEYAARGEAGSIYPWGNEFDGSRLNYCDTNCSQSHADQGVDDGFPKTAPAGSYPQGASWLGVLNLGGNVSEWTADWLGDYNGETVSNPVGPETGREKVLKGCSWFFPPAYCRGATRGSVDTEVRLDYLGFRCALPLGGDSQE